MKKIFTQKNFNNLVGTPLDSRGYTYSIYIFAFKFTLRYLQPDIIPIVTGVVDTGGKFAAGIVDTGGKFATGINNTSKTGGKICRRCLWYRWQICHRCRWYRRQFCRCRWYRWSTLSCEYLREIFKKIRNGPNGILRGLGETDSWKKPEAKNLVTLSL